MVSRKVIDELYKKFRRTPRCGQQQDMVENLIETVGETHNLSLDNEFLTIGTLESESPFRRIIVEHIHGVALFEKSAAIVLPYSIVFLNRRDPRVSIHFKPNPTTFWDKVKWWLHLD